MNTICPKCNTAYHAKNYVFCPGCYGKNQGMRRGIRSGRGVNLGRKLTFFEFIHKDLTHKDCSRLRSYLFLGSFNLWIWHKVFTAILTAIPKVEGWV